MYLPAHFREDRLDVLHQLIRDFPLATVISVNRDGLPEANAMPLLLDPAAGAHGVLRGHFARANPQWKSLATNGTVLVVFQGPDAYVTPAWYPTKKDSGKVVPTWNYAMVQLRGTARINDDRDWLAGHVRELTGRHEEARAEPWSVDDAPPDYIAAMLRGIVGLEIEITSIEGKWKVSQNRTEEERAGVVEGLEKTGGGDALAMAHLVRESALPPR